MLKIKQNKYELNIFKPSNWFLYAFYALRGSSAVVVTRVEEDPCT